MKSVLDYQAYLFDLDGTLVKPFTNKVKPEVYIPLTKIALRPDFPIIAIVTNQGGVSWRMWLKEILLSKENLSEDEIEEEISHLPTKRDVLYNLASVKQDIERKCFATSAIYIYAALAYQSKKGNWADTENEDDHVSPRLKASFDQSWRKPNTGMWDAIKKDFPQINTLDVLMVGDRGEDREFAKNCGIDFMHAEEFFKKVTEE